MNYDWYSDSQKLTYDIDNDLHYSLPDLLLY